MGSFKIKTGKPLPGENFVLQNKPDFGSVVKSFKGFNMSTISKTWLFGGSAGVLGVAVIVATVLWLKPANDKGIQSAADTLQAVRSFVESPVPEFDIPFETFSCDKAAADLTSSLGSVIHIPERAFETLDGKPVDGPVELRFREFHHAMDLFRSGIPMSYDSAGQRRTFESAGMFELLAYRNGEPLKLAGGKRIDVDLISYNPSREFNTYYLDTNQRNWEYLGKNVCEKFPEKQPQSGSTAMKAPVGNHNLPQSANLITPQKAQKQSYVFKADYKKAEFSELTPYSNLLFEVATEKSKFSAALYQVVWTKVDLEKSRIKGYYLLHLERPDTAMKLFVRPVFLSKDYEAAMTVYRNTAAQKQTEYQQKEQLSDQVVAQRKSLETESDYYASIQSGVNAATGFRRVNIPTLGIFNCDQPIPVANYEFKPQFTENGASMIPSRIYVTDLSVNAIYEADPGMLIRVNRKADIVMWIVTKDNRIAVWTADEFDHIAKGKSEPVFPVETMSLKAGMDYLDHALRGENDIEKPQDTPDPVKTSEATFTKEAPPIFDATVFPNPATDFVNIQLPEKEPGKRALLSFFNASGQAVMVVNASEDGPLTSVNVSGWKPGTYYCRIDIAGQGQKTLRFIKQ
jgi:hypothetical protein